MPENSVIYDPSFKTRLQSIKGIVWDLDNTLYRLNDDLFKAFNIALARAALDQGLEMGFDDAVALATKSFEETGYSGRYFIEQHDVEPDSLHYNYHGYLDEKIIEANREVQQLFDKINLEHVLVTHSSVSWASRVLSHLDLAEWFDSDHILGMETYDFERKSESKKGFELALKKIGIDAQDVVMIEDTMKNLKIPHEMGMGTVFLHHGQPPEDMPDYVQMACNNSIDVLETILTEQKKAA